MATIKESKEERRKSGALFIPAGLLLGMGVGFLVNSLVAGIFIGLGVGFLIFAMIAVFRSK